MRAFVYSFFPAATPDIRFLQQSTTIFFDPLSFLLISSFLDSPANFS